MKTKTSLFMSALTALTLALGALSPEASGSSTPAGFTLAGSYTGRLNDREDIDLLIQDGAAFGRKGSYLGILLQIDPKFMVYRIDPLTPNSFAMNPIQVTDDGELGVINDDPSLVLTLGVINKKSGKPNITITNANSGNTAGFQGSMIFDTSDTSVFTWLPFSQGLYRQNGNKSHEMTLPQMYSWEAPLSSNQKGNFLVQEKINGVFTIKSVTVTSTGTQVNPIPGHIAIFVERDGMFGRKVMMLLRSAKAYDNMDLYTLKD